MNRKPYSQILDSLARDHMADSIDLAPRVLTRIQRGNHFTMKPKTLFAAILFALMLFASLFFVAPGVAAAIQGWFGYVPGLGLVRAGQIRVLAGPVSVTRDGVTVTVENALMNSEKTLITYRVDGIRPAMSAQSTIGKAAWPPVMCRPVKSGISTVKRTWPSCPVPRTSQVPPSNG